MDIEKRIRKSIENISNKVLLYLGFAGLCLVIYLVRFPKSENTEARIFLLLGILLHIFFINLIARLLVTFKLKDWKKKLFTEISRIIILFLILAHTVYFPGYFVRHLSFLKFIDYHSFLYLSIVAVFLLELSTRSLHLYKTSINPARAFIFSFVFLILIGTGLLMLPKATTQNLSIVDALFMSTSAVCVTGLAVVDTASHFTTFGKVILLFLFQTGGLGIMTFTSFFGFIFKGEFSYQNQLFLQNILNEDKMGEIFKSILKIVVFTLGIELVAAIGIYFSVSEEVFVSTFDHLFFSIFHSVSAFCNAGFSSIPNGLFHDYLRFNYSFLLIISFLIIFGGLGFPIVFNFYKYLKYKLSGKWDKIIYGRARPHSLRIINVNTKIVIITTVALLTGGTVFYLVAEWNHTLKGLTFSQKLITSFFGSVTPRTAGFNTVDMTGLAKGTVLIYLFLMWVGASPGSTGGGIKTSTLAIAILNTFNIASGKERMELLGREITDLSIKRSLTIIFLSLLVIGFCILTVSITDSDKDLLAVAFECISAFGTVGLSLGITSSLSFGGKLIIILTMLVGRVGTLTIIIAFLRQAQNLNYRYPKENIFIN